MMLLTIESARDVIYVKLRKFFVHSSGTSLHHFLFLALQLNLYLGRFQSCSSALCCHLSTLERFYIYLCAIKRPES
jgi:hypothetical protein